MTRHWLWARRARSTSPAARWSTSPPASPALAAILMLRKRLGYPEHAMHPNSMVLTLTGAGLLWFGWFGFNGGSGLASGDAGRIGLRRHPGAAAAAGLSWMLVEWFHSGKPTALGLASGMVAGPGRGHAGLRFRLSAGRPDYRPHCRRRLLCSPWPEARFRVRRFARRFRRPRRRRLPRRGADRRFLPVMDSSTPAVGEDAVRWLSGSDKAPSGRLQLVAAAGRRRSTPLS